jgi:hypothetical protein
VRPGDIWRACGKARHWAKDCKSNAKKTSQTHLAKEEEDDLLLVQASELSLVPRSSSFKFVSHLAAAVGGSPTAAPVLRDSVHLLEERVFAQFVDDDVQVNATS